MKPTHTVMKLNLVILLVLLTVSTGAAAQSNDNREEFAFVNSSARLKLPNGNQHFNSTAVIQQLSYNPIGTTRLDRSAVRGRDKRHRSDLQWKQMGALPPGARLVVEKRDGGWVKGKFLAAEDGRLSLRHDGAYLDLLRTDILRIRLRGGRKTGKGAMIGMVTGAVAGSLLVGAICSADDFTGNCGGAFLVGGLSFGALGAGLGAGVGSLARARTLIYEAHMPELVTQSIGIDTAAQNISVEPGADQ